MRIERSRRLRYGVLGAGFALASAGAAVGGIVAGPGSAAPKVTVVNVVEKEFSLSLSTRKLHAGKVTFVALDKGKLPHALAIAGPGARARTAVLSPGKSARFTVTLKAGGMYTIWCPVGTHASLGMKTSLKIPAGSSGAGVAPTPAPAATTSTSSGGGGGGWG